MARGCRPDEDAGVRCFLALEVPGDVRRLLVGVQERLRGADADVRWVAEGNVHLSLKFLGELTAAQVGRLSAGLRAEAARRPAMKLAYEGLGVFPERGLPRVVWAGVTGDLDKLADLAAMAERVAEEIGVPRERRPFVAHLTLGRVRSARNSERLQAALGKLPQSALGGDTVRAFALYRSTLTPQGPVHQIMDRFHLGG